MFTDWPLLTCCSIFFRYLMAVEAIYIDLVNGGSIFPMAVIYQLSLKNNPPLMALLSRLGENVESKENTMISIVSRAKIDG